MKRTIIRILVVCSVGIAIVVVLEALNRMNRPYSGGGFIRHFPAAPLTSFKSLRLLYNSFYIAGRFADEIYLGTKTAHTYLLVVDSSITKQTSKQLIIDAKKFKGPSRIVVDSCGIFVMRGYQPAIYKGRVGDLRMSQLPTDSIYFKDIVSFGSESFLMRTLRGKQDKDIIIKISPIKPYVGLDTTMLESQGEGIFSTDGMLHFSHSLNSFVYVYFYRNEFILSDTTLLNIRRVKMIDTTSQAKISIADINSENAKVLATPPVVVNKRSSVSNDWLFIQSGLLSDNQRIDALRYYEIIDVYNLRSRSYRFSFYLPFQGGRRLTSFKVFDKKLVVLFEELLYVYDISPQAFLFDSIVTVDP